MFTQYASPPKQKLLMGGLDYVTLNGYYVQNVLGHNFCVLNLIIPYSLTLATGYLNSDKNGIRKFSFLSIL